MVCYGYTFAAVLLVFKVTVLTATDVTVRTNVGTFIGEKVPVDIGETTSTEIATFLGIPYAEPPVGKLRFRFPVAKASSTTHRVVQKYRKRCIEFMSRVPEQGSEDCLYLNVFAPDRFDVESLPVMIYVHGGGFVEGSANDYDASLLAAYGNVIIVTINYRLGVWGFLSTEDSSSPGNYGLWDQRLAIKWVHDNIAAFGGDIERITLFGESAGAASVVHQGLFPGNRGLFKRIIAQSGSAVASWAVMPTPRETTEKLATFVGCYDSNTARMVECLRSLPADNLTSNIAMEHNSYPSIDNVFVTCDPRDILDLDKNSPSFQAARETFASFDFMTGINSGEGIFALAVVPGLGDMETFLPNKTFFDEVLVPGIVQGSYSDAGLSVSRLTRAITSQYTDAADPENPYRVREQFLKMYSDAFFLAPMHVTLSAHAQLSQRGSYMYYLSVNPSFHLVPTPSWFEGANHADDLIFLFPPNIEYFSAEETVLAGQMATWWTNFAKTGNPNEPRDLGLRWGPYAVSNRQYLEINLNMTADSLKANMDENGAIFWNDDVPDIIGTEDKICNYEYKGDTSGEHRPVQSIATVVFICCHILFLNP